MAYKSSFLGTFSQDSNSSSSTSGGYKSPFSGTFAAKKKRQEEEAAAKNYAEELRKEQKAKADEEQKAINDSKSFWDKSGDFLKSAGESIAAPFKRTGEGIAEIAYDVTGGNERDQKAYEDSQNQMQETLLNAIKKSKDTSLTQEQRDRWRKLADSTSKDMDEAYKARTERTDQLIERTDPVKGAAAIGEIGLNVVTAGTGGAALQGGKIAAKEAAKEGVKLTAKETAKRVAAKIAGEGAKGIAKNVAKDAAIGGAYGITSTFQEKGSDATIDDVGKNLLVGATIGAAVPIAAKGTGKVLKAGERGAINTATKLAEKTQNEAVQRSLKQIGEDGIMGTLNKSLNRTGSSLVYKASDALNKTKVGSKVVDLKDDFMSKWVTEFHPLYKTLKRSDFEGKTQGAYLAAREAIGNSNRALSYAQDFVENNPNMQKLTASIAADGTDLVKARANFDEFAKIKSELDLAAAGKKSFSKSKMQELNDRMAVITKDGKNYDSQYGDLVNFYKDLNNFRVENGLISKEAADQFEKEGFDYVRQQRELPDWMLDKPAPKGRGSSASITKSDAIQKRSKYASAELLSPMETAIKTAQLAHVEAYRNKAAKTVVDLLEQGGNAKIIRSTDMVKQKRALLTQLKESKPIARKMARTLSSQKKQLHRLETEMNRLSKEGLDIQLARGPKKEMPEAFKYLNKQEVKYGGLRTVEGKKTQPLLRDNALTGTATDRLAISGGADMRKVMKALVTEDPSRLKQIRRMLEARDEKLGPLLDTVETMNRDLHDLYQKRSGLWQDAQGIKTTVNKSNQTTMSFLDDGTENVAKIDPVIASAVHNWDKQSQNVMNEVLRFSNNVFKYGTTGANAGFALPNFVADQVGSAINSKSLMATHNPRNFVHSFFMTIGKPLNAEDSKILEGYLKANKGQVSINQYTKQATGDKAANALVKKGANWGQKTYTVIRHPKEGMRALFDATEGAVAVTENLTRIQNYRGTLKKATKEGLQGAEKLANQAARENSVDFLEMGSYGRVINSLIPYFNASIQGSRTMLRNAAERPASFAGKTAALVGVPTAATTIWNTQDKDRKAIYDTIPQYLKDTNFIVITPGAKWNEDKKKWDGVWMMKKPPGFKAFTDPVQKFIEYKADGGEDLSSFLKDEGGSLASDFAGQVQPIDFSSPNKFLSSVTPQLLKPTAEAILNKNFFQGTDIVPEYLQSEMPADQKYEHYSQLTSHIAAMFNTSPLKVDSWIKETFGEVGTNAVHYADRLSGAPENAQGGRSLPESVSRRFYGAQGGADTDAFYKSYEPASNARKRASSEITTLVKAGRINEAKRKAEEYNSTIKDRFSGFMRKFADSPNYGDKWDQQINDLFIPTSDQAFKARARQK